MGNQRRKKERKKERNPKNKKTNYTENRLKSYPKDYAISEYKQTCFTISPILSFLLSNLNNLKHTYQKITKQNITSHYIIVLQYFSTVPQQPNRTSFFFILMQLSKTRMDNTFTIVRKPKIYQTAIKYTKTKNQCKPHAPAVLP